MRSSEIAARSASASTVGSCSFAETAAPVQRCDHERAELPAELAPHRARDHRRRPVGRPGLAGPLHAELGGDRVHQLGSGLPGLDAREQQGAAAREAAHRRLHGVAQALVGEPADRLAAARVLRQEHDRGHGQHARARAARGAPACAHAKAQRLLAQGSSERVLGWVMMAPRPALTIGPLRRFRQRRETKRARRARAGRGACCARPATRRRSRSRRPPRSRRSAGCPSTTPSCRPPACR